MRVIRMFQRRCLDVLPQYKPVFSASGGTSEARQCTFVGPHHCRRLLSVGPCQGEESSVEGNTEGKWNYWNIDVELDSRNGVDDNHESLASNASVSEPLDAKSAIDVQGNADTQELVLDNRKKFTFNRNRLRSNWVCEACGHSELKWYGACTFCKSRGTLNKVYGGGNRPGIVGSSVPETLLGSRFLQGPSDQVPTSLKDVKRRFDYSSWRISLSGSFGKEVSSVLGGGIVPGSLILVGGDPGVGKSTLLLQIAASISQESGLRESCSVLYCSGEESVEQVGNRADRLEITADGLYLYTSTDIGDILENIEKLSPSAVVVDSIQTVCLREINGNPGSYFQVKECTGVLLQFAKRTGIPIFVIGHATKSGDIAGPRSLEHLVDVVLYMDGDRDSNYRMLRPVKNRFASTDELGVFEMSGAGLCVAANDSEIFMSEQDPESDILAGVAVAVMLDKSRSFLIQIQALCLNSPEVGRNVTGVSRGRVSMIASVLIKQAGLLLQENSLFVNVVNGVTVMDTAADLAIAAAICSSFLEVPLPKRVAYIGEIGLGGQLHMVRRLDKRVNTVARLGYSACVVPSIARTHAFEFDLRNMKLLYCKNLKELINTVFDKDHPHS